MICRRDRRRTRGVTLMETLAALALVALTAPVFAQTWRIAMDCAARARAQITAATLAENRLTEMIVEDDVAMSEDSGDFSDLGEAYQAYQWRSSLEDWSVDDRFRQLDVTVTWTRRNQTYETTLSTVVDTSGD